MVKPKWQTGDNGSWRASLETRRIGGNSGPKGGGGGGTSGDGEGARTRRRGKGAGAGVVVGCRCEAAGGKGGDGLGAGDVAREYGVPDEFLQVDTTDILFICGGAFIGLEKIISARSRSTSIGFGATVLAPEDRRSGDATSSPRIS
jgi:hypothetical protein